MALFICLGIATLVLLVYDFIADMKLNYREERRRIAIIRRNKYSPLRFDDVSSGVIRSNPRIFRFHHNDCA